MYEPTVFWQIWVQVAVPVVHSSMSVVKNDKIDVSLKCDTVSPVHDRPSEARLYPVLQLHVYDPIVLAQFCAQPSLSSLHSSMSKQ